MPNHRHLLSTALATVLLVTGAGTVQASVVDDFESGLPFAITGGGLPLGFIAFWGDGSVAIDTTTTTPAPVPGAAPGNSVLRIDVDVTDFGGVVHNFENPAVDTWTPQDWSAFDRLGFWLHGNNSGTELYVDLLDNRNPGSTTNDVEIFSAFFSDDFSGWQYIEIPFAALSRRDVFPGAPDDGLTLTSVHGWAFGTLGTGGPQTYYLDSVQVVPEPGSWALMAAGLAAVAAAAARRRRA